MPQVYQVCLAKVGQLGAPQECDGFITRDERERGAICAKLWLPFTMMDELFRGRNLATMRLLILFFIFSWLPAWLNITSQFSEISVQNITWTLISAYHPTLLLHAMRLLSALWLLSMLMASFHPESLFAAALITNFQGKSQLLQSPLVKQFKWRSPSRGAVCLGDFTFFMTAGVR